MPSTSTSLDQSGPLLDISILDSAGNRTVALEGELDMSNAAGAEEAIRAAHGDGPGRVVVDLSGLTFIDSAGIRLLLKVSVGEDGLDPPCDFTNPSAQVRRVLEIAGVADRLPWKEGTFDEH